MYPFYALVLGLLSCVSGRQSDVQNVLATGDAALHACHKLATTYPDQTISISDPEYPAYQSHYWAKQQTHLQPYCRFLPSNAKDVRSALEILYAENASFAVVSGGHTSNSGFSNIDGGVTIDLSNLNQVQLTHDEDENAAWIGPGARWGDVYKALEPERLTVAGAHTSHVGVGGFVLGGGISWFANQVGFSCDSVLGFEVVTPGLQIRYCDKASHTDLFWALKGSAGSFGVVTAIKMQAIEISLVTGIYAGTMSFDEEQLPEVLSVLAKTSTDAENDEYTSSSLSIGYIPESEEYVYNAYIVNNQGHDDTTSLNLWKNLPSKQTSLRHTTIIESANEISNGNPLGLRRSKFTFTTSVQLEKVMPLHTLFRSFASKLGSSARLFAMNFQPLTTLMLNRTSPSHNPNIFSETLVQDMVPLLVVFVELWWSDDSKDAEFEGLMKTLEKEMLGSDGVDWAKHDWVYPNYAASWQKPFNETRLGTKTVEKLREVRDSYDPKGVWGKLRAGVWHV